MACSAAVTYVTCGVSQASVPITGTTAVNVTGTINVASTLSKAEPGPLERDGTGTMLALLGPLGVLALAFTRRRKKMRKVSLAVLAMFGLAAAMALNGCSGGVPSNSATANTPSGSQLVTFTATAAGVTQSTVVTVVIQ
jgi:MYXO-CTERM domain-containing protein